MDPDGGVFTYSYDARNMVEAVTDPDGARTTFAYDAAGQRTTLTDASGATRQYAYDNTGRLTTQIELNSSSSPILTIVDTYDAVGNRTGRNQDGTVTTWVYDDAYRLTGQLKAGERATFVYDAAGNTLVKWHEGSAPMTFAYDAANRITTLLQGATLTTFSYDPNGNLVGEATPGGSYVTYRYDRENRLTEVQSQAAADNAALSANGASASASSSHSSGSYAPSGAINGDRAGANWGSGGGWNDGTQDVFPDWIEVDFGSGKTVREVNVFTVQDGFAAPSQPTEETRFTLYGVTDFEVQYWDGSAWQALPGGSSSVTGNDRVWRRFVPSSAVSTQKVRVTVSDSADGAWSRITEVEAWTSEGTVSTYTYDGDGLRRSAHEPGGSLTTFVWDGDDYLMEMTP